MTKTEAALAMAFIALLGCLIVLTVFEAMRPAVYATFNAMESLQ